MTNLVFSSDNPLALSGVKDINISDNSAVYLPLEKVDSELLHSADICVVIVLTGYITTTLLIQLVQIHIQTLNKGISVLLFSQNHIDTLSRITSCMGWAGIYGRLDVMQLIKYIDTFPCESRCRSRDILHPLTNKEAHVLVSLLQGKPVTVTALELNVTIRTVYFHQRNIMAKLGIRKITRLLKNS